MGSRVLITAGWYQPTRCAQSKNSEYSPWFNNSIERPSLDQPCPLTPLTGLKQTQVSGNL
jgi:hypothetical protein